MSRTTLKLATWNVNGIRASLKKNFWEALDEIAADVVLLQETKVDVEQLDEEFHRNLQSRGYEFYLNPAVKKGYSGTAVLCNLDSTLECTESVDLPSFSKLEGRLTAIRVEDLFVLSCYFPNSQRDHKRLKEKLQFCSALERELDRLAKDFKVILGGDLNIAPFEIDLKNPKTNHKTAGFLPEERAWLQSFLNPGRSPSPPWTDAYRHFSPTATDRYTWWSQRPGVREKNIGWRIDSFLVSKQTVPRLKSCEIFDHILGSDHAPVVLELAT